MKTLDRYIAGMFLKNLLIAVTALVCLFAFQGVMGDLLDRQFPGDQILVYHLLNIPRVLVEMMPPAVLLATVFTLSGLARTNELIASFAIGVSLKRIVTLLLTVVFMVSCLLIVLQDRILPLTYKKRTTYYWHVMKKKPDFFLDIKQDKIWYRSKNLIFNLRLFDPQKKIIHGMSVYTFNENFDLVQVVSADRAKFTKQGWKLLDGTVTVFPSDQDFPLMQKFTTKDLLISETPKDFQEIEKEVDSLRLKELYRYVQRIGDAGADTKSVLVKLHSKISISFMPLIMCVLGVPFSVRSRREGGVARDLGLCLALTFFYWLFYSIGLSLGTNGALPPWLAAWLPSTFFGALAVTLIARQK
ncbi:MAG: LPS export ABC transporter permease LptG [Bdellovibrionales bacterium GWB1_55_8]|nr:MAG: LPS export ABC transporter permease LptG [Bdellovibrionales bacterium GWB1_55_8]